MVKTSQIVTYCHNELLSCSSPIPLGSTVLIESILDKQEARKTFVSCKITSSDGSKLHTEATGDAPFSFWTRQSEVVSYLSPYVLSVFSLPSFFLFHFCAALFVSVSVSHLLKGWHPLQPGDRPVPRTAKRIRVWESH